MEEDSITGRTRRRFLQSGAGLTLAGLAAGCSARTGDEETTETTTTTETADETAASTAIESETPADESYSVSMEPAGTVEFDGVPETWFPFTGDYADMGVALGQAEGLQAIGLRPRYAAYVYEELDGVSVDTESLTQLWQDGTGKEVFYELDADVHLIDPNFVINRLQWSEADVEEIATNVAPFVGNTVFSRVYDWHDYAHYTMYEAFAKVAEVLQQRDRYEAFAAYHDELLETVRSRLPEETPDIAVLYPAGVPPESFYPYLVGEGTQSKHWRDLNVGDVLGANGITDAQAGGGTIDYEALLEIDPDAIAVRLQGEITDEYFEENIVSHMENHEVASQLRAVQNGRVVYGGLTYQGPIIHLFQLERAAQGLYPDEFGSEELFDRGRVSDIVTGDF